MLHAAADGKQRLQGESSCNGKSFAKIAGMFTAQWYCMHTSTANYLDPAPAIHPRRTSTVPMMSVARAAYAIERFSYNLALFRTSRLRRLFPESSNGSPGRMHRTVGENRCNRCYSRPTHHLQHGVTTRAEQESARHGTAMQMISGTVFTKSPRL